MADTQTLNPVTPGPPPAPPVSPAPAGPASNATPASPKDLMMRPGFFLQPEVKQIEQLTAVDPRFDDLSPAQQMQFLRASSMIAQHPAVTNHGAPPPTPVGKGTGTLGSALERGTSEGSAAIDRIAANLTSMVGLDKVSHYFRNRQQQHEALAKSLPEPTGVMQNLASAVPQVALQLPRYVAGPIGAGIVAGVEHADEPMASMIGNQVATTVTAGLAPKLGGVGEKILSKLPFTKSLPSSLQRVGGVAALPFMADVFQGQPLDKAIADAATLAGVSVIHGKAAGKKATAPPPAAEAPPAEPATLPQEAPPKGAKPTPVTDENRNIAELVHEGQAAAQNGDFQTANLNLAAAKRLGWDGQEQFQPPAPQPGVPVTGPAQRTARGKAAAQRAVEADPTALWRKGYEGLGIRIAPEETGELPTPQPPTAALIQANPNAQPPKPVNPLVGAPVEPAMPAGNDYERNLNPSGQQYTAKALPGIPAGATVIPRGLSPQGFIMDVVDSSGRANQRILPFRDSLYNMVRRGMLSPNAQQVQTYAPPSPDLNVAPLGPGAAGQPGGVVEVSNRGLALPPAPTPTPLGTPEEDDAIRAFARKNILPAVNQAGLRVVGQPESLLKDTGTSAAGQKAAADIAAHDQATRPGPRLLPAPSGRTYVLPGDASGLMAQPNLSDAQHLELAKQQPKEVVQDFVRKMETSFIDQLRNIPAEALTDEQKATVKNAYSTLQSFLAPYKELAGMPKAEPIGSTASTPRKTSIKAAPAKTTPSARPKLVPPVIKGTPAPPAPVPEKPASRIGSFAEKKTVNPEPSAVAGTPGELAPATPPPDEAQSMAGSIVEQAKAGGLKSFKVSVLDKAGKEVHTSTYDVGDTTPGELTKALTAAPGANRVDITPTGNPMGVRRWSKFFTGASAPRVGVIGGAAISKRP